MKPYAAILAVALGTSVHAEPPIDSCNQVQHEILDRFRKLQIEALDGRLLAGCKNEQMFFTNSVIKPVIINIMPDGIIGICTLAPDGIECSVSKTTDGNKELSWSQFHENYTKKTGRIEI